MNDSEEALNTKQLYVKQYFFCHGSRVLVSLELLYEVPRSQSHENAALGRTSSDEWSARRRDLYLTTHNTHNRQTTTHLVGFEPTIPASEQPYTHALDCEDAGIDEQ
jgi:hypothetical protein